MPDAMISAFEIIGPSIIGPSSSHTAGAARLALWARRIAAEPVREVTFVLQGSFADTYQGHGTDRALLAGLLGYKMDDPAIRDAYALAGAAGLTYSFEPDHDSIPDHPNTVIMHLVTESGRKLEVEGQSLGGAQAKISAVNGMAMSFQGNLNAILLSHKDRPGILALITSLLAHSKINIASLTNYRNARGREAYTLLETDDFIEAIVKEGLQAEDDIYSVMVLRNEENVIKESHKDQLVEDSNDELFFRSATEAMALCRAHGWDLATLMYEREGQLIGANPNEWIDNKLETTWADMKASVKEPLADLRPSMGGFIGGEAKKLLSAWDAGVFSGSERQVKATAYAMAVSEQNASMGRIVAAPTAGAAGVIPGVLLSYLETSEVTDREMQRALLVSAAIGYLLHLRSSLSGAEGGCQAEVGSAAAMAAAAIVSLEGGSVEASFEAASFALANLLGLVCDPIGGLVEAPCQGRNAGGSSIALSSAQLALAGLKNPVPFDEMLEVHKSVGSAIPHTLRETARGGMATAPTAISACANCAMR